MVIYKMILNSVMHLKLVTVKFFYVEDAHRGLIQNWDRNLKLSILQRKLLFFMIHFFVHVSLTD